MSKEDPYAGDGKSKENFKIRRVSETHWIARCLACPKKYPNDRTRSGVRHLTSELDCKAWWLWHRATESHLSHFTEEAAERRRELAAEKERFDKIFSSF